MTWNSLKTFFVIAMSAYILFMHSQFYLERERMWDRWKSEWNSEWEVEKEKLEGRMNGIIFKFIEKADAELKAGWWGDATNHSLR